jgi:hypothetical protein
MRGEASSGLDFFGSFFIQGKKNGRTFVPHTAEVPVSVKRAN